MKKIIYIVIFSLPTLIIGQNEIQTESNFSGRHRRGTVGLCSIGSSGQGKATNNSSLRYDSKNGLILTIKTQNLTEEEILKVIGEPIDEFSNNKSLITTIEGDFELDAALLRALKMPQQQFLIKAGSYPVTYKDNLLEIVFEVN
jgi:hypothetical protein